MQVILKLIFNVENAPENGTLIRAVGAPLPLSAYLSDSTPREVFEMLEGSMPFYLEQIGIDSDRHIIKYDVPVEAIAPGKSFACTIVPKFLH